MPSSSSPWRDSKYHTQDKIGKYYWKSRYRSERPYTIRYNGKMTVTTVWGPLYIVLDGMTVNSAYCPANPGFYDFLLGKHIDNAMQFIEQQISSRMSNEFIPAYGEGVHGLKTYGYKGSASVIQKFESIATLISGLLEKYGNEHWTTHPANSLFRSNSAFTTPWHEFAYQYYTIAPFKDKANMGRIIANMYMRRMTQRMGEAKTATSGALLSNVDLGHIDTFVQALGEKVMSDAEASYEDVFESMWDAERLKDDDLLGTLKQYQAVEKDLMSRVVRNADQIRLRRQKLFIENIENKIAELRAGSSADRLIARQMNVDLFELRGSLKTEKIRVFWQKYSDTIIGDTKGKTDRQITGMIQDNAINRAAVEIAEAAGTPLDMEQGMTVHGKLLQDIAARDMNAYTLEIGSQIVSGTLPQGTYDIGGKRTDRLGMGSTAKDQLVDHGTIRAIREPKKLWDPDYTKSGKPRTKDLFGKLIVDKQTTPTTQVAPAAPSGPVVSIQKNRKFKNNVWSVSVSLSGKGWGGIINDAIINSLFAKYGGDPKAAKKLKEAIAGGILGSLTSTIKKMTPIWRKMFEIELQKKQLTGIAEIGPAQTSIKKSGDNITVSIRWDWHVESTAVSKAAKQRRASRIIGFGMHPDSAPGDFTPEEWADQLAAHFRDDAPSPLVSGGVDRTDITALEGRTSENIRKATGARPGDIVYSGVTPAGTPIIIRSGGGRTPSRVTGIPQITQPKSKYKLRVTEPMEPVSDSFLQIIKTMAMGGGSGNIFQKIARILWAVDVPLPDFSRVLIDNAVRTKDQQRRGWEDMNDQELNEEIARARTRETDKIINEIFDHVVRGTTERVVNETRENAPSKSASLWQRSIM